MELGQGGMDVIYVDESSDLRTRFVLTAVAVPLLRPSAGGWRVVWDDYLGAAKNWRRQASHRDGLLMRRELKGSKLASGRGQYRRGRRQYTRAEAMAVYRNLLANLTFLPNQSVLAVAAAQDTQLYGYTKYNAALLALLQRLRAACRSEKRTAIIFFDEGQPEYRKIYRRARVHLPTGSSHGTWGGGLVTKNLPLDNFTKDANFKQSAFCYFTQLADIVSYAALLRVKADSGSLAAWQNDLGLGSLFDSIPRNVLNDKASRRSRHPGIVELR